MPRIVYLLGLWLLLATAAAAAPEDHLHIGVLAPLRPVAEESERWQPLARYLTQHLDSIQVSVQSYDFDGMEKAILSRQLDVVITNPSDYLVYSHRIGLSAPIVSLVTEEQGQAMHGYGGAILVLAERSDLKTLKDLNGQRIAGCSLKSLGCYQAQAYELFKQGLPLPKGDNLLLTGLPHHKAVQALLTKQVDAAFVRGGILESMQRAGLIKPGQLRVLNRRELPGFPYAVSTPLYPEMPVAALPQLDETKLKRLAAALLNMPDDSEMTRAIGIHGFTLPYDYEPVRVLARHLRLKPYDNEAPVKLQVIWNDHSVLLLVLLISFVAISGLLLSVISYAFKLRTSRQLMQQERRHLRTLLKTMPDLVWLKDLEGRYLFCNHAVEKLFDSVEAEIIGKTDYAFIDQERCDSFYEYDRLAAESDHPLIKEEWLELKNGHYQGLYQTIRTPVHNDQGELIGILGMSRDVSERQKVEEQLRKLWLAVEQSPNSIIITNLDAEIEYINRHFTETTGYRAEEVLGKNPRILQSAYSDRDKFIAMWNALGNGDSWSGELKDCCKDGREIIVWAQIAPVRQEDGKITHYVAIEENITEKKRNEQELANYRQHLEDLVAERTAKLDAANEKIKISEERYSFALDASNDGLWDWDMITGSSYCNSAYSLMLGYKPNELGNTFSSSWLELLHPDEYDTIPKLVQHYLQENGSYDLEFRMRCKNGAYKWILSRGKVVLRDGNGRPIRAVGTHTDLTLRKEMEIALREAKEHAEAASRSKSAFLANMSHEIRTPMNAILGFTHLLQRDSNEPAQLEKLGKISQSAKHLLGIINDILDFSKIEAERLILEEIHLNIIAVIDNVCSMMNDRIEAKQLHLVEEIDPALSKLTLLGDPLRLGQILLNFLSNAIKFTESGTITLRVMLESEQTEAVVLRFEVQDTGIGISKTQQQRLFKAFEQAEAETTRKYGGTGLGLVISRRLALLMGGDSGVISTLGQGSTFWFSACLKRCIEPVPVMSPRHHGDTAVRSGARLLLVEDNEINQEVAISLLEQKGLLVELAQHGAEALVMVQNQHYDLILMDLQMPVMDGLEATQRIRMLEQGKTIPIVAMTANAFDEDRDRCFAVGMNDHVAKPVDPQHLYSVLARFLPDFVDERIASTEMEAIPVTYPVLIDQAAGLKYFSGNRTSYQRMLDKFAQRHNDDARLLQEALDADDLALAERIAHSLKTVSTMLGMHGARTIAYTLERKIRTGKDAIELSHEITALATVLTEVCDEIDTLQLTQNVLAAPTDTNPARLNKTIDELVELLEQDDIQAAMLWREIKPQLVEVMEPTLIKDLEREIESFDFPSALLSLRALR